MIFGYCRVSTRGQLENNSLDQQEQEILSKYNNAQIYKEQFTGSTTDRPILNKLLNELKKNDVLVVTKLDRLARNTVEGIQIVQSLFDKEVSVHVLNVGLLENTTMGKFFLTTLLAVAEMERNTIIERTQAGKAIAKQRDDFWEGRPKIYHKSTTYHALSMLEERDENGNKKYTVKKVAQIMKMSESTLYRAARKRKAKKIKQQ